MKYSVYLLLIIFLSSCTASKNIGQNAQTISGQGYYKPEPPLTKSLF